MDLCIHFFTYRGKYDEKSLGTLFQESQQRATLSNLFLYTYKPVYFFFYWLMYMLFRESWKCDKASRCNTRCNMHTATHPLQHIHCNTLCIARSIPRVAETLEAFSPNFTQSTTQIRSISPPVSTSLFHYLFLCISRSRSRSRSCSRSCSRSFLLLLLLFLPPSLFLSHSLSYWCRQSLTRCLLLSFTHTFKHAHVLTHSPSRVQDNYLNLTESTRIRA